VGYIRVDYDGYKAGGRKRFRAYRPEPGTRYRVVILSRKEPKDGGDALAVLGVVEVVAPPVEGSVNIRVVAWRMVLLLVTFLEAARGAGGDDSGHVNVGEAVGKFIHVDQVVVDILLSNNLSFDSLRNWFFLQRIQEDSAGIF
jgi:hypothetical protein